MMKLTNLEVGLIIGCGWVIFRMWMEVLNERRRNDRLNRKKSDEGY